MPTHLYKYKIQTTCPFLPFREGLLLEWDGGWGEISPLPGFSRETLEEATSEILENLSDLKNFKPKYPSVQFGLQSASTPFIKKELKVPLSALHFPKNFSRSLKLKLGSLSLDEALKKVRTYLGQYPLRLDFNRSWPLEKALAFVAEFPTLAFEYLEEPAPNLEEIIRFSKLSQFPIAIDESLLEFGWEKIPTLKALVVKPTVLGSIPKLPKGVDLVLSSSYESSLGILQIARLAPPLSAPLGLDTISNDLLDPPLRIEDGYLLWEPTKAFPIRKERLCLLASAP